MLESGPLWISILRVTRTKNVFDPLFNPPLRPPTGRPNLYSAEIRHPAKRLPVAFSIRCLQTLRSPTRDVRAHIFGNAEGSRSA